MRLAAALEPALAARGVPGQRLCRQRLGLRRCVAAAGLREARDPAGPLHPAPPSRPRQNRTILPHACATSSSSRSPTPPPKTSPRKGSSPAAALLELNGLFTAWVETGLPPPGAFRDRADPAGPVGRRLGPAGHGPAMPAAGGVDRGVPVVRSGAPSPRPRRCRCTATPTRSRPRWPAARSSWCSPRSTWNTSRSATADNSYGQALPHNITRHAHPKARPETPEPAPAPATGIDYLPWSPTPTTSRSPPTNDRLPRPLPHRPAPHRSAPASDQLPGQLSIDDTPDSSTTTDPDVTAGEAPA